MSAREILEELRHQYLIAFESSGQPGWHSLVVRARNRGLTVRARSGYIAGQSSPDVGSGGDRTCCGNSSSPFQSRFWPSAGPAPAPPKNSFAPPVGGETTKTIRWAPPGEKTRSAPPGTP